MPATTPPESAIAKTSAATPIAHARTDRCDAEVSVAGRGCTSESPIQNIAAKIASPDVRLILVKDGEHTLSREQDLRLLTRTLGEMVD